jgi:hypothetical protein
MTAQRAHHARRDGRTSRKSEGIADREDRLAHLQLVRIRIVRGTEVLALDADDRDVRLLVSPDDRAAQDAAVREGDDHLLRAVHDMVGREDVAFVIEHDP